jgi:hypothetical protein
MCGNLDLKYAQTHVFFCKKIGEMTVFSVKIIKLIFKAHIFE